MGPALLPAGGTTDRLANAFLEVVWQRQGSTSGSYTVGSGVCLVITDIDTFYNGGGSSPQINFQFGPSGSFPVFFFSAPAGGTAARDHWSGFLVVPTGQHISYAVGGSGVTFDVSCCGLLVPQPFQFT